MWLAPWPRSAWPSLLCATERCRWAPRSCSHAGQRVSCCRRVLRPHLVRKTPPCPAGGAQHAPARQEAGRGPVHAGGPLRCFRGPGRAQRAGCAQLRDGAALVPVPRHAPPRCALLLCAAPCSAKPPYLRIERSLPRVPPPQVIGVNDVIAIGDCSKMIGSPLPATAQASAAAAPHCRSALTASIRSEHGRACMLGESRSRVD